MAYGYAATYAQWGNVAKALEWLEKAVRFRDPDLMWLKTDPYLDPALPECGHPSVRSRETYPLSTKDCSWPACGRFSWEEPGYLQ
jgi:hypothetical protein